MKKLFVYLKDYKKECILAPLFKMLEASFELFIPLVVANLIDNGINADGGRGIVIFTSFGLLILLGFIGLAASLTAQYFAAKAAVNFAANLRHGLFSHLMKFNFTQIDKMGTSTMITRMTSDVNQLQNGVNMVLRLFLRSPFVVFGAMIMAFTIDVKLALIFVIVIIALSFVVFGIMAINIPMQRKTQGKLDTVLESVRENLYGVRVIRAFRKEGIEHENFKKNNGSLTKSLKFSSNISTLTNPLTYVLINMAIVILIDKGNVQVINGNLSSGEVIALYNYMSQILVELIKLANLIVLMNKALACAKRVTTVLEMPIEADASCVFGKNTEAVVEFEHVSMCYSEAKEESLEDINFSANKGETIGIIGGTGCGKTSLVHLITGFYKVTKGSLRLFGSDINSISKKELASKVGIVMQKAQLFNGTIRSNVTWSNKNATDEEIENAIKTAQALDVIESKGGIDAEVEQQGRNFSGGQRQRISIARTLLMKPEILILDDSSSALDYLTDLNLRKAINGLDYNPTVFIVTQRCSSVMDADKIVVLDDGKVMGIGTHEELLKTCEVYREIYDSQYSEEVAQ